MRVSSPPDLRDATLFSGVVEAAAPAFCGALLREPQPPLTIIFTGSHAQAESWSASLSFYFQALFGLTPPEIQILPDLPTLDPDDPRSFETECDRMAALSEIRARKDQGHGEKPLVILTTPRGFFHPVPASEALAVREIRLAVGQSCDFQSVVDRLGGEMGYDSEVLCEGPGQYAVRGGLIDVYPVNGSQPYRVDFLGDEIEAIKSIDPTTQRSLELRQALTIAPIQFRRAQVREHHILGYLGERTTWIFWGPGMLYERFPSFCHHAAEMDSLLPTFQQLFDSRVRFEDRWYALTEVDVDDPLFSSANRPCATFSEPLSNYRTFGLESELGVDRLHAEQEARSRFLHQILRWQESSFEVYCVTNNEGEESRLRHLLNEDKALRKLAPTSLRGSIREGFRIAFSTPRERALWSLPDHASGLVVVSDSEIFGRYRSKVVGVRKRKLPLRPQVDQLLDFSDLAEGDRLVHLQHGICLYRGLTRMKLRGKEEELISLEFDENAILHLPLTESHLLSRYIGLTKSRPRLGRLGTKIWERTRRAAEDATLDFAADLLGLQAKRDLIQGHAFATDTEWQREFEHSFIHRETPDQMRTIEETKADLERPKPMDRLICGDVGFGKTEVALRAAFKAVMDGMQVAILVPTTVLAQQHYNTFRERIANFPLVVEMISRFRGKAQQVAILRQLLRGQIDIIIGTHRLLSGDVRFADLGLLIIDEEHRFGVRHKEKIKRIKENVDVLNMSATPIPRTLYLALVGARDLSVIETPPLDRLPIHTVVRRYDVALVKDAINYEANRGGQVFYLHNRVQSIDSVALRLRQWLPDLRIAIGHGQMDESELEEVMTRFVAGEFDVLVCTTIIESGLDIPNCNTIIIEGADQFGLSQLYQLRGRVGRFKRQAHAYLLLHRQTHPDDQAKRRLSAIRQYNQLGAGLKIAMRDLELRGAGNLLGSAQSGHIVGVGFDLYCQLLRQSIARLKGEEGADTIRASVHLDFVVLGAGENPPPIETRDGYAVLKEAEIARARVEMIEAYLPSPYIEESQLRITFYRQLAVAQDPKEIEEIGGALEDRFGSYPRAVEALLLVSEIRCLAGQRGILKVETEGDRLKCLRASARRDDYIRVGNRFPRLVRTNPILRLKEVRTFLKRQVSK